MGIGGATKAQSRQQSRDAKSEICWYGKLPVVTLTSASEQYRDMSLSAQK